MLEHDQPAEHGEQVSQLIWRECGDGRCSWMLRYRGLHSLAGRTEMFAKLETKLVNALPAGQSSHDLCGYLFCEAEIICNSTGQK